MNITLNFLVLYVSHTVNLRNLSMATHLHSVEWLTAIALL